MNSRTKKLELLTKLATVLPRRSGSEAEISVFLETYLQELEPHSATALSVAIANGRKKWEWFPKIPELLSALKATKQTKGDPFHRAGPQVSNGVSDKARGIWFEFCDDFDSVNPGTAESWFYPLILREPEPGCIQIEAPGTGFFAKWIMRNYWGDISSAFTGFKLGPMR